MPFLAEQYAADLGLRPTDLFSYQFALAPEGGHAIEGFKTRQFGTRHLHHCPKLRVAALHDQTGREIGFCLGVAVDANGVLVNDGRGLDCSAGWEPFWDEIERFAIGLAGRWLLLVTDGGETRIYGDASGMYNCVYDPVSGGVGSTLLVSLLRQIEESDEVDYTRTLSEGMRLPFGRTRDRHARRLGVNHFLRLDDWSETRFWPKHGAFEETEDVKPVISSMKDRLSSVFVGIVTAMPCAVGVTGGNDSRNLVAAGKPALGHVKRFYTYTHKFNSRYDHKSAALIMQVLGQKLEQHPVAPEQFSETEIGVRNQRFQASTGFSIGLHAISNIRFSEYPQPGEVLLTGNVMEALRAAHWKSEKRAPRRPWKFGLKRCLFVGGGNFSPEFVRQWLPVYREWLATLPEDAQDAFIDLAFCEQNLPNLGTLYHAEQKNFLMCPFNDRQIISLCGRLPIGYRFRNEANRDFLELAAPELVDVPFAHDLKLEHLGKDRSQPASKAAVLEDAS